ncbi:ABC transporter permease [Leptospira wolffii]|uniref:ABC transporter permease n=1 Tax=Leptospira wolffii TaxID=409998 RepID=UPI0010823278|nr:ABC transporter permease subunit [Leptospira wolffii]TGK61541.1 ABC transporter permease [Leptospira wolffii]TGK70085.1 ABC transporter permease [Leptospira wolffii]TGK77008.1 ABC transporter permease [Leptospira wolffii]TGL31140.1 ABC transporter permease [Leptospira wolffii]
MNLSSGNSFVFFVKTYFQQLPTLIRLTLVQVARRKALYFLFSLLLVFLMGERFCSMTVGSESTQGVPASFYFTITSLWVTVFLIIIGSDLLRQDIDSQVLVLWLSRPLDPAVYLAGKAVALLLIMLVFVLAVFGVQSWFALEIPWDFLLYQGAMFLVYGFFLLLAFQITLSSNQTLSILFCFGLLLVTSMLDKVVYMGLVDKSPSVSETQRWIVEAIYWILPQVGTIYHHSSGLFEGKNEGYLSYGPYSFLQVIVWAGILKIGLWWTTRRREI